MEMDYRSALLKDRSKANIQRLAEHIGEDPDRLADVMRIVPEDGSGASILASWVMTTVIEAHPELGRPWVADLIQWTQDGTHPTLERHALRSLQFCVLPTEFHGRITDLSFGILADAGRPIASRAFAITVAMRMVQSYPDLTYELVQLLQDVLRVDPGPAIRSRGSKALCRLRKSMDRPRRSGQIVRSTSKFSTFIPSEATTVDNP